MAPVDVDLNGTCVRIGGLQTQQLPPFGQMEMGLDRYGDTTYSQCRAIRILWWTVQVFARGHRDTVRNGQRKPQYIQVADIGNPTLPCKSEVRL